MSSDLYIGFCKKGNTYERYEAEPLRIDMGQICLPIFYIDIVFLIYIGFKTTEVQEFFKARARYSNTNLEIMIKDNICHYVRHVVDQQPWSADQKNEFPFFSRQYAENLFVELHEMYKTLEDKNVEFCVWWD